MASDADGVVPKLQFAGTFQLVPALKVFVAAAEKGEMQASSDETMKMDKGMLFVRIDRVILPRADKPQKPLSRELLRKGAGHS
jgi:hypothetical protein